MARAVEDMHPDELRQAYATKTRSELAELASAGLRLTGNAYSSFLLLKGLPNEAEKAGAEPLSGADGKALRASATALGYAPEEWCCLLTTGSDGAPVDPSTLRRAICVFDPATLIACDEAAAHALRETYAEELASLEDFDAAMLAPGIVVQLLGMRVLNLGGFEAALSDDHKKQLMWAYLKQVPPLGEPY